MASKRQSEFPVLQDVAGAWLSGHMGQSNYKISSAVFSLSTHTHTSTSVLNTSAVAGSTVSDALNVLSASIGSSGAGTVTVAGITPVPAASLIGNPTAGQTAASAITLDDTLDFTGSTLAVAASATPAAAAIPLSSAGGDLAAWIPNATSAVKGLVQFGGDLDATSTATSQVVSKATFGGASLTLGTIDDGEILVRSGTTITSAAAPTAATITSQATAEAGSNNTEIMSPLRTKQAVTAYGLLASFAGYTTKGPVVAADTVLINDSEASGAVKKVAISSLVSGASGLAAATTPQTLALTLDTVGVTPAGLAALNAEYRMFSEQAYPTAAPEVTISRSITIADVGAQRVFLPASNAKIPTSIIYNDTPSAIAVYPYEGNIAAGAYFNGSTAINFPRTSALGGLEAPTLSALTGSIEFTVDAWPVAGTGSILSRFLMTCRSNATNDFKGLSISCIATGGSGYIEFTGYPGGSETASFTIRSAALSLTPGALTELVFAFNLATATFNGYINGVENAWNGITQVFPAALSIAMPATSMPLRVAHRSSETAISATSLHAHLGNMFRLVLWKDHFADLTDPTVMARYRTAGLPVNIGKTGWRPRTTFTQPASLYLNGAGPAFRINQAPNFDETQNITGTVLGSSVTPAPANNATLLPPTVTRPGQLAVHSIKGRASPFQLPTGAAASFTVIEGQNAYKMGGGA